MNSKNYVPVFTEKRAGAYPAHAPSTLHETRVITAFSAAEQRKKTFIYTITRPGATEANADLPYKEECIEENSDTR